MGAVVGGGAACRAGEAGCTGVDFSTADAGAASVLAAWRGPRIKKKPSIAAMPSASR